MRTPKQGADTVRRRPPPLRPVPPWTNSAPVPASPVVLEWKRAEFQNLKTTEAVSRRSVGVGKEWSIKACIEAGKGAGTAEGGKISLTLSSPGT